MSTHVIHDPAERVLDWRVRSVVIRFLSGVSCVLADFCEQAPPTCSSAIRF